MVVFTYKNVKYLYVLPISGTTNELVYLPGHFTNPVQTVITNKFRAVANCDNVYDDICKYKINVQQLLDAIGVGKTSELVELKMEIDNIPITCKKKFNKSHVVETIDPRSFIKNMKLTSTPDKRNKVIEITVDTTKLPNKINRHKTIRLEKIFTSEIVVKTVKKPDETNNLINQVKTLPQHVQQTRVTKRKLEVPYPIKLAAGIVAFFGVLEVGSALISKVVSKIK